MPAEGVGGHYESWFLRANHPELPVALWIRYTIFVPKDDPGRAEGELWGIWFDREQEMPIEVYERHPLRDCSFSRTGLNVQVGSSSLTDGAATGGATAGEKELHWSLTWAGDEPPLLLFPEPLYEGGFPKAKALVPRPNAVFEGSLRVNGDEHSIDGWIGSQNHNWGVRHTDRYAWGQVAGFDNEPDAFLECATAQLKVGPVWTPKLTLAVLRYQGTEYPLNTLGQGLRAHGSFDLYEWSFSSRNRDISVSGRFSGQADDFAVLSYRNPPGGTKTCFNSKLATCRISVERSGEPTRELISGQRSALEIITDKLPR